MVGDLKAEQGDDSGENSKAACRTDTDAGWEGVSPPLCWRPRYHGADQSTPLVAGSVALAQRRILFRIICAHELRPDSSLGRPPRHRVAPPRGADQLMRWLESAVECRLQKNTRGAPWEKSSGAILDRRFLKVAEGGSRYHKILKKGKRKEALKNFEELRRTNPDAALKELEMMERARMQERMSLKHQNSGKWAKSKAIMAKYDEEARRAMQEQLEKNKELTRKIEVLSEEEEDKEEEIIPDFVNDAQMSLEGANPWMTGKLRTDAKDPETPEERLMEEVVMNVNTDEPEEEEESEEETLLREFEDRRRLRKDLGEQEGLEPKPGSSAGSATEDNAGKVAQFNTLFQRLLEQNKIEEKQSAPAEEEPVITEEQVGKEETLEEEKEEDSFLIQSLERHRTIEDLEALREQELPDERAQPALPPGKPKEKISQPAAKKEGKKSKEKISQPAAKKESKNSNLIDSKNILPAKERPVQAPLLPTSVEEDEDEEDDDGDTRQKMIIREAFAGDDVIRDFLKEKRDAIEASKPKDISLVLPGWGEWGGTNLKVNELPFPFKNPKHFESTIRAPVGNTWNTERAVQKLTAPQVITKRGHIIEPITEDLFQKHSATKKPAIELEKPKTKPIPRLPKTTLNKRRKAKR
ncbi:hypothetical protein GDO78_013273 [Eleutherodactylus coqui]|uniref:U3 small nucleolar RNA-associated protein 14 homolog A n=1 Tax=Eleutherodactylus coqui TaxID=57060 RepID=A0A8J6K3D8_ELECQ|nr:hypothetical protein GDO78_013273 [Eleutherodactylus coqui]